MIDLDGAVDDEFSDMATQVNNAGVEAQKEFLIKRGWAEKSVDDLLADEEETLDSWLDSLEDSDLKLLRDWSQFSNEVGVGWIIVHGSEGSSSEYEEFLAKRVIWSLEEWRKGMDSSYPVDMIREDLPKLRKMFGGKDVEAKAEKVD